MGIKKSFWRKLVHQMKVAVGQAAIETVSDEVLDKVEAQQDK